MDVNVKMVSYQVVPHISNALENGCKRIVVLSNDSDVFFIISYYMYKFFDLGLCELWLKFGTGMRERFVPIHVLVRKLGENMSKIIMKVHILTGCDLTRKIGTNIYRTPKKPKGVFAIIWSC